MSDMTIQFTEKALQFNLVFGHFNCLGLVMETPSLLHPRLTNLI